MEPSVPVNKTHRRPKLPLRRTVSLIPRMKCSEHTGATQRNSLERNMRTLQQKPGASGDNCYQSLRWPEIGSHPLKEIHKNKAESKSQNLVSKIPCRKVNVSASQSASSGGSTFTGNSEFELKSLKDFRLGLGLPKTSSSSSFANVKKCILQPCKLYRKENKKARTVMNGMTKTHIAKSPSMIPRRRLGNGEQMNGKFHAEKSMPVCQKVAYQSKVKNNSVTANSQILKEKIDRLEVCPIRGSNSMSFLMRRESSPIPVDRRINSETWLNKGGRQQRHELWRNGISPKAEATSQYCRDSPTTSRYATAQNSPLEVSEDEAEPVDRTYYLTPVNNIACYQTPMDKTFCMSELEGSANSTFYQTPLDKTFCMSPLETPEQ